MELSLSRGHVVLPAIRTGLSGDLAAFDPLKQFGRGPDNECRPKLRPRQARPRDHPEGSRRIALVLPKWCDRIEFLRTDALARGDRAQCGVVARNTNNRVRPKHGDALGGRELALDITVVGDHIGKLAPARTRRR